MKSVDMNYYTLREVREARRLLPSPWVSEIETGTEMEVSPDGLAPMRFRLSRGMYTNAKGRELPFARWDYGGAVIEIPDIGVV
jgi:hypothetical protein